MEDNTTGDLSEVTKLIKKLLQLSSKSFNFEKNDKWRKGNIVYLLIQDLLLTY